MDPAIIGVMIPIAGIMVGGFAMYLTHQRKIAEIHLEQERVRAGALQGGSSALPADFATLRESLTAHAMSVDENLKSLSSRMTSIEHRLTEVETQGRTVTT